MFGWIGIVACGGAAPSDDEAMLVALGYVAEGDAVSESAPVGVVHSVGGAVAPGTRLVVSAHALTIDLIDLGGARLHRWSLDPVEHGVELRRPWFRRAWLLDDGSILAIVEYDSMWRIAADGRVRWFVEHGNHHAIHREGGVIYGLTSRHQGGVAHDAITVYGEDGQRQRSVDVLEALRRSRYAGLVVDGVEDPLHLNSVQRIPDGLPTPYVAGRFLVSARNLDALLVVDAAAGRVTAVVEGPFTAQHEVQIRMPAQRLLLFDNGTPARGSRALELSIPGLEPMWSWTEPGWFSECCGSVVRLERGTTLIVSSQQGRAVEVTPAGEVVWDYRTPYRLPEGEMPKLFDVRPAPAVEALGWRTP